MKDYLNISRFIVLLFSLLFPLFLTSSSFLVEQDTETIKLWSEGKEAEWPKQPPLRFEINTRVDCRIGPHPVRDWLPGTIVALSYRESNWPVGMTAPYQIQLDDGRLIFAPRDINEVIRLSQTIT